MSAMRAKLAQLYALSAAKGRKVKQKLESEEVLLTVSADGVRTYARADGRQLQNIFIKVRRVFDGRRCTVGRRFVL